MALAPVPRGLQVPHVLRPGSTIASKEPAGWVARRGSRFWQQPRFRCLASASPQEGRSSGIRREGCESALQISRRDSFRGLVATAAAALLAHQPSEAEALSLGGILSTKKFEVRPLAADSLISCQVLNCDHYWVLEQMPETLPSDEKELVKLIRANIESRLQGGDKGKAPPVLRLAFHDGGTFDPATGLPQIGKFA